MSPANHQPPARQSEPDGPSPPAGEPESADIVREREQAGPEEPQSLEEPGYGHGV